MTSLVNDVVQPVIGMVFGNPDGLAALHYQSIRYGSFCAAAIDFLIDVLIIYFIFKGLGFERWDTPKEEG